MKIRSGALGGLAAIVALVLTAVVYNLLPVRGSDHQDSPLTFARPAADITDVYIYPSANPANVVLQMNVDTSLSPSSNLTQLDPGVLYQFKIAHSAKGGAGGPEDMVIALLPQNNGVGQSINVYGPFTPTVTGPVSSNGPLAGTVTFTTAGAPSTGTLLGNGMRVYVGKRADPFFFDLARFFMIIPDRDVANQPNPPAATATGFRGFPAGNAAGCDTTASQDFLSSNNANVVSIVIDAPRALIAPNTAKQTIHLWTTTSTLTGS